MPETKLEACTTTPFGSYLKSLGILRLVAEQADPGARGRWVGDTFTLESTLSREDLLRFFLDRYEPTPLVAPWNGGSGFYPKDNKEGINAIVGTSNVRFAEYRTAIAASKAFPEVQSGKSRDEDERRTAILRRCRNLLSDRAVEWLDAAVGIAADGSRSFAPILGTGGNEGRLDYTNNFMSRITALLITPDAKTPVRELLANALFGDRTTALQDGAAGQYDPGRAGGANQDMGVAQEDASTNPWDLVLTLEGAVAWASGLYRRQGVGYRAVLCSPFTVRPRTIGYGSASKKDDARAEVWTPLWSGPVRYAELRALLREGRASIEGRPARNTLEFAEAASALGVDRGIERFVRYSLLKRRGESYVALPAGTFPTGYRRNSDCIREFQTFLDNLPEPPKGAEDMERNVESTVYQALLTDRQDDMRAIMSATGRMLRRIATTTDTRLPSRVLKAGPWLDACGFENEPSVRIAAALASILPSGVGSLVANLSRAGDARAGSATPKGFAWIGGSLPDRMISVLERRIQPANAVEMGTNPLDGSCVIDPGDATLFIEGSVDDALIEDLLFAFLVLDWRDFRTPKYWSAEVLSAYAVVKCLFLPGEIKRGDEPKCLAADRRILSALTAGSIESAAEMAVNRLRIAGLRPLDVTYTGGVDPRRLAASLLIPVRQNKLLGCGIFHEQESSTAYK